VLQTLSGAPALGSPKIRESYIYSTILKAILNFCITVLCTVAGQMTVLVDCLLFVIYKPHD